MNTGRKKPQPEIVAAIATTIAEDLGVDVKAIKIVSIVEIKKNKREITK